MSSRDPSNQTSTMPSYGSTAARPLATAAFMSVSRVWLWT